jgi:hypothetical protein
MLPQLDENAKLILRTVAERDMDGYTLARHTRLDLPEIEKAVRDLAPSGLLKVKGAPSGPRLLESWFQAAPGAIRMLSAFS